VLTATEYLRENTICESQAQVMPTVADMNGAPDPPDWSNWNLDGAFVGLFSFFLSSASPIWGLVFVVILLRS
jgi:hypothetical protein